MLLNKFSNKLLNLLLNLVMKSIRNYKTRVVRVSCRFHEPYCYRPLQKHKSECSLHSPGEKVQEDVCSSLELSLRSVEVQISDGGVVVCLSVSSTCVTSPGRGVCLHSSSKEPRSRSHDDVLSCSAELVCGGDVSCCCCCWSSLLSSTRGCCVRVLSTEHAANTTTTS